MISVMIRNIKKKSYESARSHAGKFRRGTIFWKPISHFLTIHPALPDVSQWRSLRSPWSASPVVVTKWQQGMKSSPQPCLSHTNGRLCLVVRVLASTPNLLSDFWHFNHDMFLIFLDASLKEIWTKPVWDSAPSLAWGSHLYHPDSCPWPNVWRPPRGGPRCFQLSSIWAAPLEQHETMARLIDMQSSWQGTSIETKTLHFSEVHTFSLGASPSSSCGLSSPDLCPGWSGLSTGKEGWVRPKHFK